MNTFHDLSQRLAMADFCELMAQLSSTETKRYVRKINGVIRRKRGNGEVGVVQYEPVEGGKYEDVGEIPTNWLGPTGSNRRSNVICSLAQKSLGKRCLIFQVNKDKPDDQPSGFRECVWIECLE